ncbi:MAG: restriction endonuclease [Moorea sp. SIO3G5]|nr:restriction endonuclease [Moorena sp. SIO3G5]
MQPTLHRTAKANNLQPATLAKRPRYGNNQPWPKGHATEPATCNLQPATCNLPYTESPWANNLQP